ncbi:MAG: DUF2865 domain-containing protein [Bradyrhizobium sp.]
MAERIGRHWVRAAVILVVAALAPSAQAQDFFSNLFGGFAPPRAPAVQAPLDDSFQQAEPRQRTRVSGGGQAWCVRTCDGRYFPITGNDRAGRTTTCDSLCPKADTEIVYGSTIDNAATATGKPYSRLPNAFRYRDELVSGCTCTGMDSSGLASVEIEKDPTLRSGDIVASSSGLVVANKSDRRGASLEFSPAAEKIQQRYRYPAVVAKE